MKTKEYMWVIIGLAFIVSAMILMSTMHSSSNQCKDSSDCNSSYCDLIPTWYGGHNICKPIDSMVKCGDDSLHRACKHDYDCSVSYCVQGYCSIYQDKLNCIKN